MNEEETQIIGQFWNKMQNTFCDKVVLSQWRRLNGEDLNEQGEKYSHCVDNFRILAGEMEGNHFGHWFVDHDLYKWMEGAAYSLMNKNNDQIREIFNYIIDLLLKCQQEDGYINTYFSLRKGEKRWSNIGIGHELLCVGNLVEAAVVYTMATGDNRLIEIAKKAVGNVIQLVEEKPHIYPGHEEIEIALIRLYRFTNEKKYLDLAKHFIDERGTGECAFKGENLFDSMHLPLEYFQVHKPVREQTEALGHAVRATYLFTAMAELALETKDDTLLEASKKLWDNIVYKKMYITGGVGSEHNQERFTKAYDLPSDRSYSETCAEIGMMMFGRALKILLIALLLIR